MYRGWPEELGGRWYPAERGRFSEELLQQLHDDCPDCPMWPDAEDASKAMAADKVPKEKFAMMPHWLGISYWIRGRQGYWDAQFTGTGAQQVSNAKMVTKASLQEQKACCFLYGLFRNSHPLPKTCLL